MADINAIRFVAVPDGTVAKMTIDVDWGSYEAATRENGPLDWKVRLEGTYVSADGQAGVELPEGPYPIKDFSTEDPSPEAPSPVRMSITVPLDPAAAGDINAKVTLFNPADNEMDGPVAFPP